MNRVIIVNVFLMTMLIGFSAFAGTVPELGKWEKGELLLIFIKILHMSMFINVFLVFVHENAR